MLKPYHIAIDAMGGDYAPKAPIEGALIALEQDENIRITLLGTEEAFRQELTGKSYDKERLTLKICTEVVENDEHSPVDAVHSKKDSSMVQGLKMVRKGEADGFISAGNTGALLSGGALVAGRLKGVKRPALCLSLPTGEKPTLLLDVGANMDSKSSYLLQFARMASVYYEKLYGVKDPGVALLNVGVEPSKGNQLAKETYDLLEAAPDIHFCGNMEAREILSGDTPIVVTDGFAGNVLLKTTEGVAAYILSALKEALMSSLKTKIGALLLKSDLMDMKNELDPRRVGGCPLLGVRGALIKAHGNSRAESFVSALEQTRKFIDTGVNAEIEKRLGENEHE